MWPGVKHIHGKDTDGSNSTLCLPPTSDGRRERSMSFWELSFYDEILEPRSIPGYVFGVLYIGDKIQ